MSKFTKTLIASALAVAVAGPAAADVKTLGTFIGDKSKLSISPAGCPNLKLNKQQTSMGFGDLDFLVPDVEGLAFAGCWGLAAFGWGDVDVIGGAYIERKINKKDLVAKEATLALSGLTLARIIEEMDDHLWSESKCDVDILGPNGVNILSVYVKKAESKFSKNGDRVKVDIQVDGDYDTDDGKTKNIKAKVSGKMDFVPGLNPAFDCGMLVVDPLPVVL